MSDSVALSCEAENPGSCSSYVLVTPARNEARFINLTIQSVVRQQLRPLKWIIVSDGSTDGTDEIVNSYCAQHDWIELVKTPERKQRHFAGKVDVLLTLEDHALMGGFGSAVLEELSNLRIATPVERIGWPDQFIEHGKPDDLRAKYGLTASAALEKLRSHLQLAAPAKAASSRGKTPIPFRSR